LKLKMWHVIVHLVCRVVFVCCGHDNEVIVTNKKTTVAKDGSEPRWGPSGGGERTHSLNPNDFVL